MSGVKNGQDSFCMCHKHVVLVTIHFLSADMLFRYSRLSDSSMYTPSIYIRQKKKVVFTVTCLEKNGSVGRDILQPKQLKYTYWLPLCFTSIDFMFIKEKES